MNTRDRNTNGQAHEKQYGDASFDVLERIKKHWIDRIMNIGKLGIEGK